jgi:Amt family ammonium transporter
MAVIGVQWVLVGYAIAFGKSIGGFVGWDWDLVALSNVPHTKLFADKAVPELVFVMFQGKFAIITPALISGAIAERMRFRSYLVFTVLWATLIYCPLAHCSSSACSTSPAAPSCTSRPASRPSCSR